MRSSYIAPRWRKATQIPYVTHLFAVCSFVLDDGGTEDEAIAALLHDGPEDQGGEPVLAGDPRRFGNEVTPTVAGLSDAMPAIGEGKAPWRTFTVHRHRSSRCRWPTSCTTPARF